MTFIEASHVGIVVADLDASTTEFAELLGVQWAAEQHRDFTVSMGDRTVQATFRFTYSTPASGPALIELIEGQPGTPWWPGDGVAAAFHHVGFWDDELAATSAALAGAGAELEATVTDDDGTPRGFAYHQMVHGPRVELVDAARRPGFNHWLAGGSFPQA